MSALVDDLADYLRLHQDTSRALDEAGAPTQVEGEALDLAGRIRQLAQQRDAKEREREREAREANRWAGEARHARQQRAAADQALAAAGVPMDELTTDQGVTWFEREFAATRRQAAGAADDLDRARREHQEAAGEAAARELRLTEERDELVKDRLFLVEKRREAETQLAEATTLAEHAAANERTIARRDARIKKLEADLARRTPSSARPKKKPARAARARSGSR